MSPHPWLEGRNSLRVIGARLLLFVSNAHSHLLLLVSNARLSSVWTQRNTSLTRRSGVGVLWSANFGKLKTLSWDVSGSPVVKNPPCNARGCGLDPWSGNKDPTCSGATKILWATTKDPRWCNEGPAGYNEDRLSSCLPENLLLTSHGMYFNQC